MKQEMKIFFMTPLSSSRHLVVKSSQLIYLR